MFFFDGYTKTSYLSITEEWNYTIIDLSTDAAAVLSTASTILGNIWVEVALSAHACPVFDGVTQVFSIPASAAAGTAITALSGTKFTGGLSVNSNDAATGTIVVQWRLV